jgi:hypothetical protein
MAGIARSDRRISATGVQNTPPGHSVIRWMDVSDYIRRETGGVETPLTKIIFDGERLDVMSIRRLRERALGQQ